MDKTASFRGRGANRKRFPTRLVFILLILVIAIGLPVRGIYLSAKQLSRSSKILVAGAKQENLDQVKEGIVATKAAVDGLNGSLNFLIWLRLVPFIGGYYDDMAQISRAAGYELEAAKLISDSLDPYKGELGLTGQPKEGQDKIAQATKILDKILPNIDKIEPLLNKARKEVEGIDTGKYPETIKSTKLRGRLEEVKNLIIGADLAFSENRSLLEAAPSILGEGTPKTYLLLFQNDKEIRATGGFLTAYAFLRLDNGNLTTTSSDDIYRLDERLLKTCLTKICPLTPPAPIVKYLPEANGKPRSAWSMRDSNISPDFPTSVGEFERMYNMLGDKVQFDGIIAIDTQVVEELIAVTGPIDVFGTNYSADKDKRCNCPNVIYELEHYAEVASKGEEDRKAILGALMQQLIARLLGSGADKVPSLLTVGAKMAEDKHVMFFMHDQKVQQAFSKLDWTGEIETPSGDYLHINDSNFAGGKSNLYVDEKVTDEVSISLGQVKHKLTIEYKNPQPFNTWLNGILRDYVRVYVPIGSELLSSKGSDDPVNKIDDEALNKTYFEAFVVVRPQNSRTLSLEYTTPLKVSGKDYSLFIQKQPGAKDHKYVVKVNGSKKSEFDLTTDKQLNLSF
ncbi:MAG: DUF4012 domain-containing protein [bacterium]|nr:DUF4012 domain-containing protein [bacterium]